MNAQSNITTAEAEARRAVEALIDTADAQAQTQAQSQADAEIDRPSWLPAKFKTPEELAKAYGELERKLGRRAAAPAALAQPLDVDAMEAEFAETGALSDETYETLARIGVPRRVVDAYIEGQIEKGDRLRREVHDLVGGEARFDAMRAWAEGALSPEELDAFDMAVGGAPAQAMLAVKGLMQAYEAENGRPPQLVQSALPASGSGAFRSTAEVVEAMRDPRYKKDPSYRAQVEARLARSNVFRK